MSIQSLKKCALRNPEVQAEYEKCRKSLGSPLDLANGDRYEVLRVNETSVTIGLDGRAITLPADQPLHIDHAYATTAHSAQGLTCDRVFYNAESTSRTTAQDTYYVSISRERHDVIVFTDNAQKLPDAVARVPYKGIHPVKAP